MGIPGIGKSKTFEQIKNAYIEQGKKVSFDRLSIWSLGSNHPKGYPILIQTSTRCDLVSDELPDEEMAKEYDVIILFLDELNGAVCYTGGGIPLVLNLLLENTSVHQCCDCGGW